MNGILTSKKRALSLITHALPSLLSRAMRVLGRTFSVVFCALFLNLFVVGSATAAITATVLLETGDTNDTNSYTTASITPTANNLVLAWVTNTKATTPDIPTLSGNGLTWVQVATVTWGTIGTPTARTTLFRAMGAAPTAGGVTTNFGGVTQTGAVGSIVEFSGVDTSGTDGSGAVVQSVTGRTDSATAAAGLTITLAALGNAANASVGGFSNMVNSATSISAGAGYSISPGGTYATPSTSLRAEFKVPGSTTVNVTQSATSNIGGIAVELKADLCPGNVVTTTADTAGTMGSLRECINKANALSGANTIGFNIVGCPGGLCTITPATVLPALNDATGGTTIDGYTQPSATVNTDANATNAALKIELDGAGAAFYGLRLSSANNVVKGLVIKGFTGANAGGIYMNGASSTGNLISGNFIGIRADGTTAGANLIGVDIRGGATNNTVGGTAAAARNLISCNSFGGSGSGIFLGATASGNTVLGNNIGLNAAGTGACSNRIGIDNYDSASNTVGGTAAGSRNAISGNATWGIAFGGTPTGGSVVQGNWIGTNAAGSGGVANGDGVYLNTLNGTTFTIGGTAAGADNLIAYNTGVGINITASAANQQIIGNTIRNNTKEGIKSAAATHTIAKNLISNNGTGGTKYDGILLSAAAATGQKIYQNTIYANGKAGIALVASSSATIKNNLITSNGAWGINNAGTITLNNNGYFSNASGTCTGTGCPGTSNITTDPLYVNAAGGDFNLTACTSPAINTGVDLGADQPDMNGAGAGNYNGALPDMGAYESSCAGTTLGDGTSPANKTVDRNDTNKAVGAFTLLTSSGTDTLTGLTVTLSGTGAAADVAASGVKIWKDNGTVANEWDSGDTQIGSGVSFSGATATFTGLTESISTTSTQYLITYNISATATLGNTLLGRVSAATVTNALTNNDTTDATLTVTKCPGGVVTTTADTGNGSLRECINSANNNPGTTISFNIPGPGNQSSGGDSWWRISPATALPTITANGTIINGTTQTTNQGNTNTLGPEVELYGAAGGFNGFTIQSASNTIRGFILTGFGVSADTTTGAVLIDGASATGNTVAGNYIGTNYAGTAAPDDATYKKNERGIYILNGASSNTIGGTTAADRNVIAGQRSHGIWLRYAGTNNNIIIGNYIGTNAAGTAAITNSYGIYLSTGGPQSNRIGGTTAGERNIISGNTNHGIWIRNAGTTSNQVIGNYIGTDANGTAAIPNGNAGLYISTGTTSNTIGGATAAERNIISGNTSYGVWFNGTGTNSNNLYGNYIGLDKNGTAALPNNSGVLIEVDAQSNAIGGSVAGQGNIISGNTNNGVIIGNGTAISNINIYGNKIGTGPTGTETTLGNGGTGIIISSTTTLSNITIGGTNTGEANLVAYQGGDGIYLSGATSDKVIIFGNSIHSNTGLGIDLDPDGIGASGGANNNKPRPTITSITPSGANFTIVATVTASDTIEFFRVNNSAAPVVTADGSGSGEGYLYLGKCVDNGACSGPHISAVADANGAGGTVQATLLSSGLSTSDSVSATATDATNGTSEFSANMATSLCPGNVVTTTTDAAGTMGSLRECINWANAYAGADTITFNIAGCPGGLCTITPATALPALTDMTGGTTINGYSQPGATVNTDANATNAVLKIEIDGGGASYDGLLITSFDNIIKGLVIRNFSGGSGAGIHLDTASARGTRISGNFIGTTATGLAAAGNFAGVYLTNSAESNIIGINTGSPTVADRNLISGNSAGVYFGTSNSNQLKGNLIGTDKTGTAALPNTSTGMYIIGNNNTIGGSTATERNIISGNTGAGIYIMASTNTTVAGNYIGADINQNALGNGSGANNGGIDGCCVSATGTVIGGTASGVGNLIAYNAGPGIKLNLTGVQVIGNTIRNNTQEGILTLKDGLVITKNLIRNNGGATYNGVKLDTGATNNKLYNNTIHANGASGVYINDTGAILRGNSITGNGAYGINRIAPAMTESYNLVTDAATTPANASGQSNVALDATGLNKNPLYTNAGTGDFTLQAASPAINRGCNLGGAGADTGCDNASDSAQIDLTAGANPNFYGYAPDIGAYETTNTTICPVSTSADASPTAPFASLRACMNYANSNPGTTVSFSINGTPNQSSGADSWWRISPVAALLTISAANTVIDGTTQTSTISNSNTLGPEIEIYGGGQAFSGFNITSANNVIRGFLLTRFDFGSPHQAVKISGAGATSNTVAGNYIGTNFSGTAASAATYNAYGIGIESGAQSNIIGGTTAADRNIISGNSWYAMIITDAGTNSNQVIGNYIGTNASGTGAVANNAGILIISGAQSNIIGGSAAARNIISGNTNDAIIVNGSGTNGTIIKSNYIGLDVNGTTALANGSTGISVNSGAKSAQIGGTGANEGNLISANTSMGIMISGSGSDSNTIQGNYIGTDVTGLLNRGNGSHGIYISASPISNVIGGTGAGAANLIAYNTGDGVSILNPMAGGYYNRVSGNSIHSNGGLGIDLDPDGVGATGGANNNKVRPTITSITPSGANYTIVATVTSGDTIEFFRVNNAAAPVVTADASGSGEGYLFLGSCVDNGACSGPHISAVADANAAGGTVQATLLSSGVAGGDAISATATNASNDTSEFSANISAPTTYTISGTVYTDEGVTNIGGGKTVRVLVNGLDLGTSVTAGGGTYSITTTYGAGDALLLYIDGNDGITTDATTVTVAPGGNLSGIDLYVNHLITRHDNASSLTNALMDTAKGAYSDTEILYSISGGNLTVSGSGTELYVPVAHTYAPGGNVTTPSMESAGTFNGGIGSITVNGTLTQSGGTYTATSGTTSIAGNFTISAGTFNHNSGAVFLGTGSLTINTGTAVLNNVTASMAASTLTVTGTVTVAGNFTMTGVNNRIQGGTLAVAGNVVSTRTVPSSWPSSATLLLNGSGAQTLSASGGTGILPGISINKPSGTLTLQDTLSVYGDTGWTWTAGTVDAGTGTVDFYAGNGAAMTVNAGSMSFNNVTVNMGPWDLTVTGTMTVNGNLAINSVGYFTGGTIAVAGNVTATDPSGVSSSGTILFNGTGAQTFSAGGGTGNMGGSVSINKTSGTLSIQDTLNIWGNWTWTAGTVNAGTSSIAISGTGAKAINSGSMAFNHVSIDIQPWDATITGTMEVGGNFTLTSVGLGIWGGTINVGGNLTSTDATVGGTTAITLNGAGAQTITASAADLPNGLITINKASGTATLASNLTLNSAGQDLTITSGTLDLAGYNLILTGAGDVLTVGASGTLQLQGGETITITTKTLNAGSTVIYNGSGTYASLLMGNAYHHLRFNGTGSWTHTGALDANGNLTISSGTLNSNGQNVNVAGNWSNSGAYTSGANTLILDGAAQTVSGNTTFRSFTKTVAAADTLTFAAGSTTTINGTATLNGASGQLLSLVSSSPGTRWNFNLGNGSTKAISYVSVADSDASGSDGSKIPVLPTNSTDGGNNIAWFNITISGTVYTDEGLTSIGAGKTVRLVASGVSIGTAVTNASGQFSIAGTVNAGEAFLLYIDGNDGTTTDATTVSVSPGGVLSNINLYVDHLITRHDNAGGLSNVSMNTAKGAYVDTEILYSVSGSDLTVSGAATELYVPTGHSFTPGGNVTAPSIESVGTFNSGANTIDSNGALVVSGGTFTASSTNTYIGGSFTVSAGTFNHNSGLITFDGGAKTVNIGAAALKNVNINMAATMTVTGTMRIDGDLTISTVNFINAGTVTVAGNVTTNDASAGGSAELEFNGTGDQTLLALGVSGAVPSVTVNKASGTLFLQGTIEVDGSRGWYNYSGTVDAGTSTVVFDYWSKTIASAGMSFNNVKISLSAGTVDLTVNDTMDINGDLTIISVNNINAGTGLGLITVAGNITSSDVGVGGTAAITFDGTGTQTVTAPGADLPDGTITINKTSGRVQLASNLTLNGAGQDFTITTGLFDMVGYNLTLTGPGDVFTIDTNGTVQLYGSEAVTVSTKTFNTGSTVVYNGSGTYNSLALGNSYHHLTFAAFGTYNLSAPLIVNGNLAFNGTQSVNAGSQTITLTGYWQNMAGTFNSGSGTVILNGTNQRIYGNNSFNNLTKSLVAADTLSIKEGTTQTITGTASLNGATGQLLSLRSLQNGTRWNFNLGAGATKAISYVDVQDSDASGSNGSKIPVLPTNSSDSGNNIAWFNVTISGTVYTDEGVTNIGAGKTVRLVASGVSVGTAVTNASGQFSIAGTVNAGEAFLLYIDGNDGTTTDATTVSVSPGGVLSNINLYVDHLITRHDNAGGLSNVSMNTAKGAYVDTEILYSVSGSDLTVSGAATELYVPTGHSFTPGGNVTAPNIESVGTFNSGANTIDSNGALVVSGGTFTASSTNTYIGGNFTVSAGTFNHNSGTIILDTAAKTIDIGSATLNQVTLNMSGLILTITGTMDINGNLVITQVSNINGGTIAVAGNVTSTDTAVGGTGTILFDGSGDQTLSAGGGIGDLPGLSINKLSGTLFIQDTIEIDGSSGWTYTAGTVNASASTVVFQGSNKTVNSGAMSFNHATIDMSGNDLTVTGTMDVNGNLLMTQLTNLFTGTIAAAGNVTSTDSGVTGTGTILFDGAGDQILSASGGMGSLPAVSINKPSGTLFVQDTIDINGSSGWTYTAGTVNVGASTVEFVGTNKSVNAGAMSFNHVTVNMSGNDLTVTGTLDVNGNFTITQVTNIFGGAITVAGNLTSSDSGNGGTAAITLDGSGAQIIDTSGGADLPNGTLTINKASGTATLASNLTLNSAGQDLTITSGTLDLAGYNLALTGAGDVLTVGASGTLQLQGGETITASTRILSGGSTVIYNGGGAYGSLVMGNAYSNLTFNGTGSWTHIAPLSVSQNITITQGTLNSGGLNINVSGNWSNSGTYSSGANTVTFNGTGQSISGNTTFRSFTKTVASADTLTFAVGSTTTISATATLNGASGQLLSLVSSSPGTRWNFNLGNGSTKAISYVSVTDSDASGSDGSKIPVLPTNSTDGGNNIAWFNITISGTVYTDEGVTTISAGKTVRLLSNGSSIGTALTNASGQFSISGTVNSGDAILLFIDGNDGVTTDATTISVSPGGALSNINLYVDHLITRHDNAGSLTNALMNTAKGAYSDTEIIYSVSGSDLTANGSNTVLYVPATHTYAPGGNVTTTNVKILGTLTGGAATLNATGNWDAGSGVFNAGTSTVLFTGGWPSPTFTPGGSDYYKLTVQRDTGVPLNISGTATVTNDLYFNTGTSYHVNGEMMSGTINARGNIVAGAFAGGGTTVINVDGTGAQSITSSGGQLPSVTVNKASGTLTLAGTIDVEANWTYTAGTVAIGTSTLRFSGARDSNFTPGGLSYYNLAMKKDFARNLSVLGGAATVTNDLIFDGAGKGVSSGTVNVAGNFTIAATSVSLGYGTVELNGTGNQTITAATGGSVPSIVVNKTSGTLTMASDLDIVGSWTHTAGTFDPGTYILRFLAGDSSRTFTPGSATYYNVTAEKNAAYTLSLGGNLTLSGTLNVNSGTLSTSGSSYSVTAGGVAIAGGTFTANGSALSVSGNWNKSGGTFTAGTSALTFTGAGNSIFTPGAATTYGGITLNKSAQSNSVSVSTDDVTMAATRNLTVTSGILDLSGRNLTVPGALTVANGATLQLQGGETVSYGSLALNAGSTVIYNGSGAYGSLVMGNAYHHLRFNGSGSWTHTGALDANGNLTISSGTLNSNGQNVNVAGNWSNSGAYTSGVNTVILDGAAQTVSGNTTFRSFTKSVAAADTLTFAAGSTTTINGTATLTGESGQLLSLVSSSPGTRWNFNLGAASTKTISYVSVTDSDASGSDASKKPVGPSNSTDGGNDIDWFTYPIVKQMWEENGAAPLAPSSTIARGASIVFLIYVKNTSGGAFNDVRITDILDDSAFLYVDGSMFRTSAATPPADTATDKQIFDATAPGTGTNLSEAVDGDVGSSQDTHAPVPDRDKITIGAVTGQANAVLNIPAHTTFAIRFKVTVK